VPLVASSGPSPAGRGGAALAVLPLHEGTRRAAAVAVVVGGADRRGNHFGDAWLLKFSDGRKRAPHSKNGRRRQQAHAHNHDPQQPPQQQLSSLEISGSQKTSRRFSKVFRGGSVSHRGRLNTCPSRFFSCARALAASRGDLNPSLPGDGSPAAWVPAAAAPAVSPRARSGHSAVAFAPPADATAAALAGVVVVFGGSDLSAQRGFGDTLQLLVGESANGSGRRRSCGAKIFLGFEGEEGWVCLWKNMRHQKSPCLGALGVVSARQSRLCRRLSNCLSFCLTLIYILWTTLSRSPTLSLTP
jgi:hypothetical protein